MNIKEIALKVWYSKNEDMPADGMSKLASYRRHAITALIPETRITKTISMNSGSLTTGRQRRSTNWMN